MSNPTQDAGWVARAAFGLWMMRRLWARVRSTRGVLPAFAVLGVLAVTLAIVRPRRVIVNGRSMEPTLVQGDRLLVARSGRVRPGELVAARDPTNPRRVIVKRITAVRQDEVILRGDNPEASIDSRMFGPVPRSALLGKVVRRYAPNERAGVVV